MEFAIIIYKLFIIYLIFNNVQAERVGAINLSPMMECKIGTELYLSEIIEQKNKYLNTEYVADFSGYELDILIRTATLNKTPFNNIKLTCYPSKDEMLNDLKQNKIDYGVGGIHIDYIRLDQGFQFSLPLYTGGLNVAIKVNDHKSIWAFFDPFHWSLWIVMLFTTLFVSIITWLFEDSSSSQFFCKGKYDSQNQQTNNSLNDQFVTKQIQQMHSEEISKEESQYCMVQQKHLQRLQTYKNFLEMVWQSFSGLFFASSIRLQKFSARSVFLGFWFMVIIVTATYTSNLTTLLSYRVQMSTLNSYKDIVSSRDVRIYTFDTYIDTYIDPLDFAGKKEDIFITFPPTSEGLEDLITQFNDNKDSNGNYLNNVLLLDTPIVNNVHSRFPCSTAVLHDTVNNFNYGVIVQDISVLKKLNSLLYSFIDDPYWLNLIQTYINESPEEHSCFVKKGKIDLKSIAGLWVLLAVSILIAFIINRLEVCQKKIHQKKQKENQEFQKQKMAFQNKPGKLLVDQYNASPSLRGDQLQSDTRKIESNQLQNNSLIGKIPSLIHQNELVLQNPQNSRLRNDRASFKKDNLSGSDSFQECDENKEIWSDFLLVSDYIHIPSDDIHLQVKDQIKEQINLIELMIKKRFHSIEENIIRVMKKSPMKSKIRTYNDLDQIDDQKEYKKKKDNNKY